MPPHTLIWIIYIQENPLKKLVTLHWVSWHSRIMQNCLFHWMLFGRFGGDKAIYFALGKILIFFFQKLFYNHEIEQQKVPHWKIKFVMLTYMDAHAITDLCFLLYFRDQEAKLSAWYAFFNDISRFDMYRETDTVTRTLREISELPITYFGIFQHFYIILRFTV